MPARSLLTLFLLLTVTPSAKAEPASLLQVLQHGHCPGCRLADADLVHADLRNADLQGAQLQRANLSQARLDGADLSDSDLSFTSLQGASLRGADLRGSRLYGTDLRGADLSGALLNNDVLGQSHWAGARGIAPGARTHAGLHNAGIDAVRAERWPDAERLLSAAIRAKPSAGLSWVARGLSRGEQGKNDLAARDLAHAGRLYADQGDPVKAQQLLEASRLAQASADERERPQGNGVGFALLESTLSTIKVLAPAAMKVLIPMIP